LYLANGTNPSRRKVGRFESIAEQDAEQWSPHVSLIPPSFTQALEIGSGGC
jgi:hypothetical protein